MSLPSLFRQANRILTIASSNITLRPSSTRQYSSSSSRTPLTLDDVLPATPTSSSPSIREGGGDFSAVTEDYQQSLPPGRPQERFGNSRRVATRDQSTDGDRARSGPFTTPVGEKSHYSLLVHSTPDHTRLTLTHTPVAYLPGSSPGHAGFKSAYPLAGAVVARVTAGSVGFKRGRRQEYEAATQACLAMFAKIRELIKLPTVARVNANPAVREGVPRELEVVFNGFGIGRDAFLASLLNSQATDLRELVRSLRDSTVVKIGGPRPKKRRRV
ncbi:uncharacterized protein PGTG_15836 [Puccinia graminis f. sp. tritici CRL 75-36-700-3]|uniref:Uncharacterized protein n=1 Tax=Puccinia graminis f. sp. tritici (strain CRL 75-36-700-3 / race SCCL) TaxID=418459 RepID=E3KZZ9_PUCGT|nr:uncharacterized protein PGTG_15836 [Puccinia graminis f. sp. tritici CRL 75-36-700-3]EFP89880.1 hypothetical protein PGTG_15836 [Puccinia graminis f. sp. tritici CRL 75-36-700-3]